MEIQSLFNEMAHTVPSKPRAMRMTQYYSKHYYGSKIKPILEPLWATEQKKPSVAGEKKLTRIQHTNKITDELWKKEGPDFQQWLTQHRDSEHQEEVKAWEQTLKQMDDGPPDTADSYHR